MPTTQVLIVGAGPTGLVLALWLSKIGVKVRIIDKAEKPGTTSRALVIHARSLEFYHQMGIAEIAIRRGIEIKGANIWTDGKKTGHIAFSDLKENITPYQFMFGLPQDEEEEMLEQQLAEIGVKVERSTELISFSPSATGIQAQLAKPNGEQEQCEATYLAGCDGAHSTVRKQLGVRLPGGTYDETFYVADIKSKGQFVQGEVNIALDEADFLAIFPLKAAEIRLVGTIRQSAINKEQLEWDDVSEDIIRRLKLEVEQVNWFSTYRVHHRVASHFRKGNVFLLGDAAHIHSPVGGQGMNTGIGDAVNLAWKIGAIINEKAPAIILDTYEQERIPFAKRLVDTTDKAFEFITARSSFATWVRLNIVPYLVPWLAGFVQTRRLLFRTMSQTSISYPKSLLSAGSVGKVKAGERLPWVKMEGGPDNFESLTTMKWQMHVYGTPSKTIQELCDEKGIKLNVFSWNNATKKAGLKENAIYIIRPDGHIGMGVQDAETEKITAYFDKWSIHN